MAQVIRVDDQFRTSVGSWLAVENPTWSATRKFYPVVLRRWCLSCAPRKSVAVINIQRVRSGKGAGYWRQVERDAGLGFTMRSRNDPEEELLLALRTTEKAVCETGTAAVRAINHATAIWIVTRTRHDHISS